METENKKCKLRLKDVSKPNEPFEISCLDKFREVGSYTWIAEKITDEMGFPDCVNDTDDCHCCEGQLFVLRHGGAEETNQSTDSFGQVLTMINHETGNTNVFTRAVHPLDSNEWQPWQMVATGDPKLIAVNNSINEVLSTLRQQIESNSKRIEFIEFSKLGQTYNIDLNKQYNHYKLDCSIPVGLEVVNIGYIPFDLYNKDKNQSVRVYAGKNIILDFEATYVHSTSILGAASFSIVGEFVRYDDIEQTIGDKTDRVMSQKATTDTVNKLEITIAGKIALLRDNVYSFDFETEYAYFLLEHTVPTGYRVKNTGSIAYYLYDKDKNTETRIPLQPNVEAIVDIDVKYVRAASYLGQASLLVYGDLSKLYVSKKELEQTLGDKEDNAISQKGVTVALEVLEDKSKKAIELGERVMELYNTNILNPEIWEKGSINSSGGNNDGATTSARTGFIELQSEGSFIVQTKIYENVPTTMTMYVNYYSDKKNSAFVSRDSVSIWSNKNGFVSFNTSEKGAKFVKIALTQYVANYEKLPSFDDVMVTESDSIESVDYFIKYGSIIPYRLEGLESNIQSQKNTENIKELSADLLAVIKSRFDGSIVNVAYSVFGDDIAPVNTIEHFKFAVEKGFNSIKTDMRLTRDNGIVLCHDNGFTLNADGRIIKFDDTNKTLIRDLTLAEVLNLKHELYHESLGYYSSPATLESFLQLCKVSGVVPYITFRNEYIEETMTVLSALLKKYRYEHSCIVNIYPTDMSVASKVRSVFPLVCICYTIGTTNELTESVIDNAASLGNAIVCANKNILLNTDSSIFDYAVSKDIRVYGWSVDTKETYETLVNKGCSGFQIVRADVL